MMDEDRTEPEEETAAENRTPEEDGDLSEISLSGTLSVQLPWRKVADVNEIISGWQKEWNEGYPNEQESAEAWHFHSPAFLPGNRLAFLFELDDEVPEGHGRTAHILNRYRVLIYDLGSMEVVGRFAFHSQDMEVRTVLSAPDGEGIMAVVKVTGREDGSWSVYPMVPVNDDAQFRIGPYVRNAVQLDNGWIAASYSHNDLDETKIPVAAWDPEGKYVAGIRNAEDMECAALTPDNRFGVWAHFMPSGKIVWLGSEELTFQSVYQGFDAFGISTDRMLAAVSWQKGPCENRMYLMYRKGDRFEAFGKLDFSHLPGEPDPLGCGAYGFPVFRGSRFVFNKDGVHYLFDLDSAAEIWR